MRGAYEESFAASGKDLNAEHALDCAELTSGYPYMIQLVGYYVWQAAERNGRAVVEHKDVIRGFNDALLAFGDAVCAPAFDGLSSAGKKFVLAMIQDEGAPSKVADIAERAGKSRSWASKYRDVLIAEKVIEPDEFGYVRFAIPHMAEYLASKLPSR